MSGLGTSSFTMKRTTMPNDIILKVNINVIGATKTLKFDGTCTVREAMRLIAHKCLLNVSDEDLETQFVLYKPSGDFDGTYLENHSSYLSANNLQNQDWIEFRRRPTKLIVQNITGTTESLLVDFDASISSLILFLSKKYNYKEPEKLDLYLQARPDEALQLGLSLVEQGVEAGACVLLQKKEKHPKMSIFRSKGRGSNYPGGAGVVKPWQPPGGQAGPKTLIFGGSLEDTLAGGRDLPVIMVKCITYVRERGIDREGIFRLSGSAVAIEGFKRAFNEGQDVDLNNCIDIHVVCGLLKQFLRELREPLLTFELYDTFLETGCQLEAVKAVLGRLPESNVRVLRYLLNFLSEVASHSATNKMPMHNLATVFAPNLLRMREENIFRIVQDTPAANALTSYIIQNYHTLFPEGNGAASNTGARFAATSTNNTNAAAATATATAVASGGDDLTDYVSYVRVAYAYEPQDASELNLAPDQILGVLQDHESGWWKGEVVNPDTLAATGTIGIFPATYCDPYTPPAGLREQLQQQQQPAVEVTSSPAAAAAATKPQPSPRPARLGLLSSTGNASSSITSSGSGSKSLPGSVISPRSTTTTTTSAAASAALAPPMSPTSRSHSGGALPSPASASASTSPRTPNGGVLGSHGSDVSGAAAGKRPLGPATGSLIVPPSREKQAAAAAAEPLAGGPSRVGLAPGGRGKFATMRAPPMTPAEQQARAQQQQQQQQNGANEAGQPGWEAGSPRVAVRSPPLMASAPAASSSVSSRGGSTIARPMVPPKELKPRLISTYAPASPRRPSDGVIASGAGQPQQNGAEAAAVVDWEKEAHRLRELLEKEQQARSALEQRVLELEQQLSGH